MTQPKLKLGFGEVSKCKLPVFSVTGPVLKYLLGIIGLTCKPNVVTFSWAEKVHAHITPTKQSIYRNMTIRIFSIICFNQQSNPKHIQEVCDGLLATRHSDTQDKPSLNTYPLPRCPKKSSSLQNR